MGRAPCCEKVGLKRGRWTAEEDEILMRFIQANGEGSWRSLPKNAGLLRCGKSCRLRWINYLRADLKRGNISSEEEDVIIKLHSSFGNRWSLIAAHLPGRTDNEIKNYWNSHLSRKIHTFRRVNNDAMPVAMDIGKLASGCKRNCGRTNKSAMKKNTTKAGMRREKHQDKESPSSIFGQKEKESMVLGSYGHTGVVLGSNEGRENEVLVPNECLESGMMGPFREQGSDVLDPNEERGSVIWDRCEWLENGYLSSSKSGMVGAHEKIKNGVWGTNEEGESGVMDTKEERENGVLGTNGEGESGVMDTKEEIENGVMGVNEERSESEGKSNEWSSTMDSWVEEDWMDWRIWEGLEDKVREEGQEIWSCLWESDIGEGDFEEEKLYSDWLMSSDNNVL
ncbi:uncharacterized protein LOC143883371 [Tasmannia lanceolata]|uniref:uncharacterized protein LOC143883371 n=1 Tax=Tasmannia lanceolata TaxID=3420 RepID=UPI0040648194